MALEHAHLERGAPRRTGVAHEHDGRRVACRARARRRRRGTRLGGRGHAPRLPTPAHPQPTVTTNGAVGRLAAPRSGRGVGACTRPKRRGSSTMATTQVNGTDDQTPAGPPRRRVPMALVTWVFVVLDPADRGRAPRGEDHPGHDDRRATPRGAGLVGRRPRRHVRARARSSTPSGPTRPSDPGQAVLSGQPPLSIGGPAGRGLRGRGVLSLLRGRALGPGGRARPVRDLLAPRGDHVVATPRSSPPRPPSPSTAPPTGAAT